MDTEQTTQKPANNNSNTRRIVVIVIVASLVFGFVGGGLGYAFFERVFPVDQVQQNTEKDDTASEYVPQTTTEEAVTSVVEQVNSSVVSVIATKDIPDMEQFYYSPFGDDPFGFQIPGYRERDTEERQVSSGTGFVAGTDLIVTNKHVVADTEASYSVVTANGETFEAEVLMRDPVEDLAILSVNNIGLEPLELGTSEKLQAGQTVITIGNALGQFENSISTGVVSGLSRTVTATGVGFEQEILREVIQTDAAINQGNSGGPLLNLSGEVVGINVARAAGGAENIGFAVPVDRVKNSLQQAEETGEVVFPFLGVRYVGVTPQLQEAEDLPYDYGALVVGGSAPGEEAVVPGSSADKAGITENTIILEVNGERITPENPLAVLLGQYSPGDEITLKIYIEEEKTVTATLGERP